MRINYHPDGCSFSGLIISQCQVFRVFQIFYFSVGLFYCKNPSLYAVWKSLLLLVDWHLKEKSKTPFISKDTIKKTCSLIRKMCFLKSSNFTGTFAQWLSRVVIVLFSLSFFYPHVPEDIWPCYWYFSSIKVPVPTCTPLVKAETRREGGSNKQTHVHTRAHTPHTHTQPQTHKQDERKRVISGRKYTFCTSPYKTIES